jgi:hypothetical protein
VVGSGWVIVFLTFEAKAQRDRTRLTFARDQEWKIESVGGHALGEIHPEVSHVLENDQP